MKTPLITLIVLLLVVSPFTPVFCQNTPGVQTNAASKIDPKAIVPAPAPAPPADDKGLPLPLHQLGGSGGILTTLSAYIVNPPRNGEILGRPAIGGAFAYLGHDMDLESLTITESPYKRIELGYGWERMSLGNLPQVLSINTQQVYLHNLNARFQLLEEGEFNQKWLPAITAGVHFKFNDGISNVNNELGGALYKLTGIRHSEGTDFTLYASKMIKDLPCPVLLELGGRATESVWDGFGGFTGHYNFVFEGNAVVLLPDNFALAAEYREMPRDYNNIGNIYTRETDWWTLDAAYVVNKHMTVALAYLHMGNVLNHQANGTVGVTMKWEF